MLTKFVSIYVPSTREVNIPLTKEELKAVVNNTAAKMSSQFGGCTATAGIGYYVSNDGILVEEIVTILKSFHDNNTQDAFTFTQGLANELKVKLTQESVTVENNDGIEFV